MLPSQMPSRHERCRFARTLPPRTERMSGSGRSSSGGRRGPGRCRALPVLLRRCRRLPRGGRGQMPCATSPTKWTFRPDHRGLVLADLVALGQVGIEVVLAREESGATAPIARPSESPVRPRRGSPAGCRRGARSTRRLGWAAPNAVEAPLKIFERVDWRGVRCRSRPRRVPRAGAPFIPDRQRRRAGASRSPAGTHARCAAACLRREEVADQADRHAPAPKPGALMPGSPPAAGRGGDVGG